MSIRKYLDPAYMTFFPICTCIKKTQGLQWIRTPPTNLLHEWVGYKSVAFLVFLYYTYGVKFPIMSDLDIF
jgi:hypothetical protein